MDPDTTLITARKALAEYHDALDTENTYEAQEHAERLAEAFEALDKWMTKGGLLPDAWVR